MWCLSISFSFFKFLFIFEGERERERMSGGGAEREGDTGSELWDSRLWAVSTAPRSGAQTHKPWDRDLSWNQTLSQLSHPGTPYVITLDSDKRNSKKHHAIFILMAEAFWNRYRVFHENFHLGRWFVNVATQWNYMERSEKTHAWYPPQRPCSVWPGLQPGQQKF